MNIAYYTDFGKAFRRVWYLVTSFAGYIMPSWWFRHQLPGIMKGFTPEELETIERRVNYYCRAEALRPTDLPVSIREFKFPFFSKKRFSSYFFDLYYVLRYFPRESRFAYLFGDITEETELPAFVKSRPITDGPTRSVIMKLVQLRHFHFIEDPTPFSQKKDMLVSRTTWAKASVKRSLLNKLFLNHPMCDVGKTRLEEDDDQPESVKPFISIEDHLKYKFIACVEGNDVATNLKWVMSSNSIAVTPKLCYETWFMEGTLVPGYHFIQVEDDFSDLIEKLQYYIDHPDAAQAIIDHAHEYIRQFQDSRMERAIQVAVAQKYFELTNCRE
ncbi:MAG: lipopolysaccharide A protein [Bacteroidaceae bacterium]|nr:lipopolysaccharide A protein [Bacteroidaceae bacterium]